MMRILSFYYLIHEDCPGKKKKKESLREGFITSEIIYI